MFQSSEKNNQPGGSKSFFSRFIDKMAGLSVIDRRRKNDRRKNCAGYTGPEHRRGIDRRELED